MTEQTVLHSSTGLLHHLQHARTVFDSGHALLVRLEREWFKVYFRQKDGDSSDDIEAEDQLRKLYSKFVRHLAPLDTHLVDEDLPVIQDLVPWNFCGELVELALLRPELPTRRPPSLVPPFTHQRMKEMTETEWTEHCVEPMEENYRDRQELFDRLHRRIEREEVPPSDPRKKKNWETKPPPEGRGWKFGPLSGCASDLAKALDMPDERKLRSHHGAGAYWVRRCEGQRFEIWFDTKATRDDVYMFLRAQSKTARSRK